MVTASKPGSRQPLLDTERSIAIIGAGPIAILWSFSHQAQNMEQVVAGLRRDLAKIGATIRKIYDRAHWRYFPHVTPTEIANGYYCPVNPEIPQLACPFSRLLRCAFRHIETLCV